MRRGKNWVYLLHPSHVQLVEHLRLNQQMLCRKLRLGLLAYVVYLFTNLVALRLEWYLSCYQNQFEKQKQDDALSDLSNILGDLKGMAVDMGGELDRSVVLLLQILTNTCAYPDIHLL